MNWSFQEYSPNSKVRNPIIGEFFSTEAIDNPAEALVREGIQNAMDAKVDDVVNVRILLVSENCAPPTETISRWFNGGWDHWNLPHNGLYEPPSLTDSCPYLVFEDFGTSGLTGDVRQTFEVEGSKNPFFYFFRAEGLSGKSESDRGRWGIGKHVFPRTSGISSYFGYSIRRDDGCHVLMGNTILKSHHLKGKNFEPDGYFGLLKENEDLILPIDDKNTLECFRKDFQLVRKDQPGLSIVVPFVDKEISFEQIKEAVISGYFYPILNGELVVVIETPSRCSKIDSDSILDETTTLRQKLQNELFPIIDLTHWAIQSNHQSKYVLNPCSIEQREWSDDLIPVTLYESIRNDLDNGNKLAIHIDIQYQQKGEKAKYSSFDVFLCKDGFIRGLPIFIREGIIISDIKYGKSPGVRSLVIISENRLASMLGDSENPAHTQWQRNSSNFKNKYINGKYQIDFVIYFVSNFIKALGAKEEQEDRSLFQDIFSISAVDKNNPPKPAEEEKQNDEGKSGKDLGKIVSKKKNIRLTKLKGGFRISTGDIRINPPGRLKVQVGYDLRKGNPIKKYNPWDFKVEEKPINYLESLEGLSVISAKNNLLTFNVLDPDFQLNVAGFDEKRDLIIDANLNEGNND